MISFVIVLYEIKCVDSITWKNLLAYQELLGKAGVKNILVYDNSLKEQNVPSVIGEIPVEYIHDERNLGIQVAYETGFKKAQSARIPWLGLLDQDTTLNESYFNELAELAKSILIDNQLTSALYPQMMQGGKTLSPFVDEIGTFSSGTTKKLTHGINSASIISVNFLTEIGGFSEDFPLDYLDHWLNYELKNKEKTVYIMKTQLEHELSVGDIKSVSEKRLTSILQSEKRFQQLYKPVPTFLYYFKYFLRICKYLVKDPKKVPVAIKVLRTKL